MSEESKPQDPNVMKPSYPHMDFCVASVETASGMLGVFPRECIVYCSREYAHRAQQVSDKYDCTVHLVPKEILKDFEHWAVTHGHRIVWSDGA